MHKLFLLLKINKKESVANTTKVFISVYDESIHA